MWRVGELLGRVRFFRTRPVLAAFVSAFTLLVIGTVAVSATPLRCGPARALGLRGVLNGCPGTAQVAEKWHASSQPTRNPPSGGPPHHKPASGNFPPYTNPASGAFPPQGNGASPSGHYPPFYAPTSGGSPV